MMVTIKFFVPLNMEAGVNRLEVALPDEANGETLLRHLAEQYADVCTLRERFRARRVYFLDGKEFVPLHSPLYDGQVLTILPSGSCCHP